MIRDLLKFTSFSFWIVSNWLSIIVCLIRHVSTSLSNCFFNVFTSLVKVCIVDSKRPRSWANEAPGWKKRKIIEIKIEKFE
jgi:hypothetical protein